VPGPGPDIVAEREYPDEKELGLPSSRRGDWARMSGGCSVRKLEEKFWTFHRIACLLHRSQRLVEANCDGHLKIIGKKTCRA